LTETDGSVAHFNANGTFDYIADAGGNRVTAGYTAGRLTKLTHSAGQSLTIAYNAAGLVASVTDSLSRQILYSYDGAQHLTAVQDTGGLTTHYGYNTTAGTPAEHALTSIEYPDGTHDFFDYDAEGRLAAIDHDNNTGRIDFSRDSAGKVTLTDNLGATKLYFDQRGLVAKVEDPLNAPTFFTYDAAFNLLTTTDANGQSERFTYDGRGNVLLQTDELGNKTRYTYNALSELTSLTDARNNKTFYAYDLLGNFTSETHADNSVAARTYSASTLPQTITNRRNQTISYEYNAFGQVKRETFPDGSHTDYEYDAHQNLASVTDASVDRSGHLPAAGRAYRLFAAGRRHRPWPRPCLLRSQVQSRSANWRGDPQHCPDHLRRRRNDRHEPGRSARSLERH